jgi:hypothetical protein
LTPEERSSAANGIWLCANCSRIIDANGGADYPATILREWKKDRESEADRQLGKPPSSQMAELAASPSQISITTHNQSGGIAAGVVNIHAALPSRCLSPEQSGAIQKSLHGSGLSVLVFLSGDAEANAYGNEIVQALLASGVAVQTAEIETTVGADSRGIAIRPNGHDPTRLLEGFKAAGIPVSISSLSYMGPLSIAQRFAPFIGLVIGLR